MTVVILVQRVLNDQFEESIGINLDQITRIDLEDKVGGKNEVKIYLAGESTRILCRGEQATELRDFFSGDQELPLDFALKVFDLRKPNLDPSQAQGEDANRPMSISRKRKSIEGYS